MESCAPLDRRERRQFRQLTKDLDIASGFGEPPRPRHHVAKDALGAVVTLAVFGMIILEVTDGLASRCGAGPNSRAGACSGAAAFARHAQLPVTVSVAACAGLALLTLAWYLLWGYKMNGPASGTGHTVSR